MKSEFRVPPPRSPIIGPIWTTIGTPIVRRSKRVRRPTIPFEDRPQLVPVRPIWEQLQEQAQPVIRLKVEVIKEVALKKARVH